MGVCNWSLFCCRLLWVHSCFAIFMGKRELSALIGLSSCCLMIVVLALPCRAMGLSAVCDCSIS